MSPQSALPARSNADTVLYIHAAIGAITALILAPAGILLARYGRMWPRWAAVNRAINLGTVAFAIAAFATGQAGPNKEESDSASSNAHPTLGIVTGVAILVQVAIGIYAKRIPPPSFSFVTLQKSRHPIRWIHVLFGLVTAGLLYGQVFTGIEYWNEVVEQKSYIPKGAKIVFWVSLGIEVAVYLVGWPLADLRGRRRRAVEEQESIDLKIVESVSRP